MEIRQKQLLDGRLEHIEVPWRGRHYRLHLLWTSWRSWRKKPLSLQWPSTCVDWPGPPPWPFHMHCPMSFPWTSVLNAAQPLSQGLLSMGLPQPFPIMAMSLPGCAGCVCLLHPVCHGPLPYMPSNFSAIVLCTWWLHNPGAMDLCSCELQRPPGSKD